MTYALLDPAAAATQLRELTGVARHDVAVVLGSGWAPAADTLGQADQEFAITELPGFPLPQAPGHVGKVRSIRLGNHRVLVFLGRVHLYDGHGVGVVVHSIRTAIAAGCRVVVLTNASGGLNLSYSVGQPVLISDHLNLTATSPLAGPRFVDLTEVYSARLRALCRRVDPALAEGVYAQVPGPNFETPAEIRMIRTLGGDLVGMSTALEAIAAREAGAEVLGISLVTNSAAGMSGEPLNYIEVLDAGRKAAQQVGYLLAKVLERL